MKFKFEVIPEPLRLLDRDVKDGKARRRERRALKRKQ
jgi:hypothetical protein